LRLTTETAFPTRLDLDASLGDYGRYSVPKDLSMSEELSSFSRLCNDVALPCDQYDVQDMDSKIFSSIVAALKRLVTEKPALLGAGSQMHGVG
jgi:hypothetical protein